MSGNIVNSTSAMTPDSVDRLTNGTVACENGVSISVHEDGSAVSSVGSSSRQLSPRVYTRRFLILGIFCLFSMSNAFQWIEYAIISNIIAKYYVVEEITVNWTSVIYMVTYIPGIIPASWLLEKKGIRYCVILGAFGTCIGAWIKCGSVHPDRFWKTMIGQTIVAISQLFILNLPPRLAAVWFSESEVSRATAIGVFGNQFGIALGFVMPPKIVPDGTNEQIANGLGSLFSGVAIVTTILLVVTLFLFKDKQDAPPSNAQAQAQLIQSEDSFKESIIALGSNRSTETI